MRNVMERGLRRDQTIIGLRVLADYYEENGKADESRRWRAVACLAELLAKGGRYAHFLANTAGTVRVLFAKKMTTAIFTGGEGARLLTAHYYGRTEKQAVKKAGKMVDHLEAMVEWLGAPLGEQAAAMVEQLAHGEIVSWLVR